MAAFDCIRRRGWSLLCVIYLLTGSLDDLGQAAPPPRIEVEGQPLAANVSRLLQALEMVGRPLAEATTHELRSAIKSRDADALQELLDPQVLLVVALNPEARVKVSRGPASAKLQQAGFTTVLVKIINESTSTAKLKIVSPQAGPVYGGSAKFSLHRQQQTELADDGKSYDPAEKFLAVEMLTAPPMTAELSGLEVEYAIALLYSQSAGKREATIGFDLGQGNQDLGFRGEVPVLFQIEPAVPVEFKILDHDGQSTVARLLIRDALGQVYPPQAKRLAPDFFFQPHVYRQDGETILLPPGKFVVESSRGPEYRVRRQPVEVTGAGNQSIAIQLERWIDPAAHGYYSGDHHIHGAGCAHYTSPTEGVTPDDMFRQVKGEGLNVGCVLTWGPCFRFQRQYFEPKPHDLTEPLTVLKYDLEISGFGSQSLGHVCLLNLRDQEYPGSEGTETKGWPTWTTPVLRWCKAQGGVTGYAHSASGLAIDATNAATRLMKRFDTSNDELLSPAEAGPALLPEAFEKIDRDRDRQLSLDELRQSHDKVADQLPNLAIPEMNGVGAMELCVSTALGACDFISAMDTARIQEWSTWYHVMNCGFPLKVSGETDFPCMSSRHVGQGRVYVRLGNIEKLDYGAWCRGIAEGRSYVADGYAHALEFAVNGVEPGPESLKLPAASEVAVTAKVAFARETPLAVAYGGVTPAAGRRVVGDTVELHGPRSEEVVVGGRRLVEVIVNGEVVAKESVDADGQLHDLTWRVPVARSSWIAIRHFPQFHTNPVTVTVAGKPVRASRESARWCLEVIDLLWKNRERMIAPAEREAAQTAFEEARQIYRQILSECEI